MIIAVDIGNTTISLGVLKARRVTDCFFFESNQPLAQLKNQLGRALIRIKKKYPRIQESIVCSVVPKTLKIVQRILQNQLKCRPIIIGKDIKVPIRNKYRNPKQVGQDRLVGAYAAKTLYGTPTIIIDFGTAITFDFVSQKGAYEGGIIVPGIRLSAESLFKKTALLPKIPNIKGPRSLIGKNTQESILSGLFYGYGTMSCGLINLITKKFRGTPKVVITGGYTKVMRRFIEKRIDKVDNDLVFKGMSNGLSAKAVTDIGAGCIRSFSGRSLTPCSLSSTRPIPTRPARDANAQRVPCKRSRSGTIPCSWNARKSWVAGSSLNRPGVNQSTGCGMRCDSRCPGKQRRRN